MANTKRVLRIEGGVYNDDIDELLYTYIFIDTNASQTLF